MPEKPPSHPPEEDFSFTKEAESEEFPEEWTPEACRRIKELYEEVGWPVGLVGTEPDAKSLINAFMQIATEEEDTIYDRFAMKGQAPFRLKTLRDIFFSDLCTVRDQLALQSRVEKVIIRPIEVGSILLRIKKALKK